MCTCLICTILTNTFFVIRKKINVLISEGYNSIEELQAAYADKKKTKQPIPEASFLAKEAKSAENPAVTAETPVSTKVAKRRSMSNAESEEYFSEGEDSVEGGAKNSGASASAVANAAAAVEENKYSSSKNLPSNVKVKYKSY
ncbi:hypothetical protein AYI70_g268 [Smittium culicis]|uniref:Uncharacterized protein n=1 Tax=Smittium culicis TaxID=133412 RepID=A0A1R1YHB7_9FUNG|nr:hypothetical protein AYI70_g268 [Smittium culicis]